MCGIVGIISDEGTTGYQNRVKIMSDLLFMDTLRGWDSTGIFGVPRNRNDKVVWYKKAIMAPDFIHLDPVKRMLNLIDKYAFMVGHNRAATKGKVNNVSAHPFIHEPVIGVHNGTLITGNGLEKYTNFSVDSEAIIYNLSKAEDSEDVVSQLDGAFALVWYDERDETMRIIRNDKRPLWFAKIKDQKTIVFASEKGMITSAVHRNGKVVESYWEAKEGREYSFPLNSPLNFGTRDIDLYKPHSYSTTHYNMGYDEWWKSTQGKVGSGANEKGGKVNVDKMNQRRKEKRKERLKEVGVEYGQEFTIYPIEFVPYGNSNLGMVFGCVDGGKSDKWHNCVVHQIEEDDYHRVLSDQLCKGKAINVFWTEDEKTGNRVPELVIDPVSFDLDVVDLDVPFEEDESSPTVEELFSDEESFHPLVKSYLGPGGIVLDQKTWDELTRHGCAVCTGNIEDHDDGYIGWTRDQQPVCPKCAKHDEGDDKVVHLH